jgi:hypothetical protein
MDARLCLQGIDQANEMIVTLPSGSERLDTLIPAELSTLSASRVCSGQTMFAKKAMALQEALQSLGSRMDQEGFVAAGLPVEPPTAARATPPAPTLAIVPLARLTRSGGGDTPPAPPLGTGTRRPKAIGFSSAFAAGAPAAAPPGASTRRHRTGSLTKTATCARLAWSAGAATARASDSPLCR